MVVRSGLLSGICIGIIILITGSCRVEDAPPSPYEAGAYVVNAGAPGANNGSISYLPAQTKTPTTDIFNAVNGRTLSGTVQDYTEINGKGVILVDNNAVGQDRIELVESGTFKSLATFQAPDVENPRFVIYAGPNKAYVSCWDTTSNGFSKPGYVLVLNLGSRTVEKKIPVSKGAERLVLANSEVFVGSVAGEPTLTVIDTYTDEVVQPGLTVGANANPVGFDYNKKLWAYAASTNEMVRINPTAKVVEARIKVGSGVKTPSSITLSADKQLFYFVNSFADPTNGGKQTGETYRFSINDTDIQANVPFIRRYFTGLGADPTSSEGLIYAATTPSYNQPGYVLRYRPNGSLVDSIQVAVAPTRFYFR